MKGGNNFSVAEKARRFKEVYDNPRVNKEIGFKVSGRKKGGTLTCRGNKYGKIELSLKWDDVADCWVCIGDDEEVVLTWDKGKVDLLC